MLNYKDIPDFPGYRVGSDGSLWSCRNNRGTTNPRWHRLTLSRRKKSNYVTACFRRGPQNYVRYVHRLVLELFVGPCPVGMEARHLNGDPTDNRVENLCWGTHTENIADQKVHGTHREGVDAPNAKLTAKEVVAIRRLYHDEGLPQTVLARSFRCSQTVISDIVLGETYVGVGDPIDALVSLREERLI